MCNDNWFLLYFFSYSLSSINPPITGPVNLILKKTKNSCFKQKKRGRQITACAWARGQGRGTDHICIFGSAALQEWSGTVSMGACLTADVTVPALTPKFSLIQKTLWLPEVLLLASSGWLPTSVRGRNPIAPEARVLIHNELQVFPRIKFSPRWHSHRRLLATPVTLLGHVRSVVNVTRSTVASGMVFWSMSIVSNSDSDSDRYRTGNDSIF